MGSRYRHSTYACTSPRKRRTRQQKKVYVQHLLQRQDDASSLLANLDQGAHVYVCGATNMGTDVMEAITAIIQKGKKMSKSGADNYLKELQNNGRYVQELWTA